MSVISMIMTCKGRLHHVQETLPLIVNQKPDEIVFVDYDCPQQTGQWVEETYPSVKVLRVSGGETFNLSRARNVGAAEAVNPWLCFIDADVLARPGFVSWLKENLHPRCYYRHDEVDGERDKETWGTCVCSREAFELLKGYDEVFVGWGGEDDDLYRRLKSMNYAEDVFPAPLLGAISHGDEERTQFHGVKNRTVQAIINRIYLQAKQQVMNMTGVRTELSFNVRQNMYRKVQRAVLRWARGNRSELPKIDLSVVGNSWMPEPYQLNIEGKFTLSLSVSEGPG